MLKFGLHRIDNILDLTEGSLSTNESPLHPIPLRAPWPFDFELSINS